MNVPLFIDSGDYKLIFTMTCVTQCLLLYLRRRNGLLDKKKNKLTCTESLMINDQTVNRHLVVGWGWAVSLFTQSKSQWNIPRSTCVIFWSILEWNAWILRNIYMFEDKKGTKLHVSRPSTKDVDGNISFEGCKVYHSQVMKLMTNTMPNLCNILLII